MAEPSMDNATYSSFLYFSAVRRVPDPSSCATASRWHSLCALTNCTKGSALANVKRRCRREREKSSRATSQQVTAGSYKHWSDETAPSICLRPFVIAQPKGKQKITKGLWRQPWNHPSRGPRGDEIFPPSKT